MTAATTYNERIAALQEEIDAMVEELRGLNDPKVVCYVCYGKGILDHYRHYADGICFTCNGTGEVDNSALPEDMGVCKGCDHAIAAGLLWGAEDAEVCPDCWEHVMGRPRWG